MMLRTWLRTVLTETNISVAISSVVSSRARHPRTSCSLGVNGFTTAAALTSAPPRARQVRPVGLMARLVAAATLVQPAVPGGEAAVLQQLADVVGRLEERAPQVLGAAARSACSRASSAAASVPPAGAATPWRSSQASTWTSTGAGPGPRSKGRVGPGVRKVSALVQRPPEDEVGVSTCRCPRRPPAARGRRPDGARPAGVGLLGHQAAVTSCRRGWASVDADRAELGGGEREVALRRQPGTEQGEDRRQKRGVRVGPSRLDRGDQPLRGRRVVLVGADPRQGERGRGRCAETGASSGRPSGPGASRRPGTTSGTPSRTSRSAARRRWPDIASTRAGRPCSPGWRR